MAPVEGKRPSHRPGQRLSVGHLLTCQVIFGTGKQMQAVSASRLPLGCFL